MKASAALPDRRLLLGVLLVLLVALLGWQNVLNLRAEEPRRALVSLEMWLTGDYLVPHINGYPYYNKPPLFNWIMAGFYQLTGSAEPWVVRLPSLLGLLGLSYTHFRFSRRYLGRDRALWSALALLATMDILFYASVNSGEIDLLYAWVVYLQAITVFHYQQRGDFWRMYLISYVLTFIGFMLKGLPSLAFQAFTILAWLLANRQGEKLFHPAHFVGIALLAALFASYFVPYGQREDWFGFLVRQYKEASQRTGLEAHWTDTLLQTLLNPLRFAQLMLPWSLLLIPLFRLKEMRQQISSAWRENAFIRFSVLFVAANVWLYWLTPDFKARYQYMFFPFVLSLLFFPQGLTARWWSARIFLFAALLLAPAVLFIDYFADLPHLALRATLVFLGLVGVLVGYFRGGRSVLWIVLFMAVARIGYNELYLRAWRADASVNRNAQIGAALVRLTDGAPIHLYGTPYTFKSDASLGPLNFGEVELTTAPLIPYALPYTVTRVTGAVMQFETELRSGVYYVADVAVTDTVAFPPLYRFEDRWQGRWYVLIEP